MRKITFTSVLIISILLFQYSYSSISILNHTPAINALNVSPAANITVQFSSNINTATLNSSNIRLYGSQSGLHNSVITFNSSNNTATIDPNTDFRVGETVEAIITLNVKSTTNDSLVKPYIWRFDTDVTLGAAGYLLDTSILAPAIFGSILFDCDNDGDLDAAAGDHEGGTMIIFKNNGSGDFSTFTTLTGGGLAYTTYAPNCADFNCDGNMDLAVPVRFSNIISVWFGNGTGNFSPVQQVGVNSEPQEVSIADFNGDGYLDIVAVCNNSGTFYYDILINDKTGHFNRTQQVNVSARPDFCKNGDADNDGDIDVFVAVAGSSSSNCYILMNNGSGNFSVSQILVANTGATPAPGDLDGDGDLDLIVNGNTTSSSFGMKVLKNNGTGTFIEGQLFGTQSLVYGYGLKFIEDINNDGYLDFVTSINGSIEIYTNDGSGNFTLYITFANNGWPAYSIGIGDLNGNGSMGICTPGNVPWVLNIYKAVTLPPLLPAPALVSPLNNAIGLPLSDTLTWNASPGADSYRLQIAFDAGFSTLILNDSGLTATSRIVNGLSQLTTYYWRVNAKNSGGTSPWSSVWNFRTKGIPTMITLLLPPNNSVNIPTTYTFKWSKAYDQTAKLLVSNYWFEIVTDTILMTKLISDSTLTDTSSVVTGMGTISSYYWHVKARNEIGWGNFAQWFKFTTVVSAPFVPVLISPPNDSAGQSATPMLDWSRVNGASSYRVQVTTDSSFAVITALDSSNVTGDSLIVPSGRLSNTIKYFWRVNATNAGGTGPWSAVWNFTVGYIGLTPSGNEIPKQYKLYYNYPNPFNPHTKIKFDVPKPDFVNVVIYDMLGREIEVLVNEKLQPGTYEVDLNATDYPSGVYFYTIKTAAFSQSKKMVLIK